MLKIRLLALLFVFGIANAFAQTNKTALCGTNSHNFQKLYLHTDREFYFHGDTIWFSGYLLNAQTHLLVKGHQNLHLHLIDDTGTTILSGLFPVVNGNAEGYLSLHNLKTTGRFVLRAHTNYLKNFGEETFFYKSLSIDKTKDSRNLAETKDEYVDSTCTNYHVQLFPEGGILLANTLNTVGVEITNSKGVGVNTSGIIVDSKNQFASRFTTVYKGKGKFHFYPGANKRYKVILDNAAHKEYAFPDVVEHGIKLQVVDASNKRLDINVLANGNKARKSKYTIACMHRNEMKFYRTLNSNKKDGLIKVDKSLLGEGINRFVLFNAALKPISERLYFNNNTDVYKLHIETDSTSYINRAKVNLKLLLPQYEKNDSMQLSLAVINENSTSAFGANQNILSHLLLSSELKGSLNSPLQYFSNSDDIRANEKLNLLMLTRGWSKYLWNDIAEIETDNLIYPIEAGIELNGYIENLVGKKRVANGEVILLAKNDSLNTYIETSDKDGNFSFKHLFLNDSTRIMLQARKSNNSENTEIILDTCAEAPYSFKVEGKQSLFYSTNIPLALYRQHYYARLKELEFEPEKDTRLLEEIEVHAHYDKDEIELTSQIYSKPDYSLKVADEGFMFNSIRDYIMARAPGMFMPRGPITISTGARVAIYLDGVPLEEPFVQGILGERSALPMSSVERIDLIKSTNPVGTASLGVRGVCGGIFIYTKKGAPNQVYEKYLKGVISTRVKGFAPYRSFYSPQYTAKNIRNKRPDYRTTLYWNPNIRVKNKELSLSFFTADNITRYKVIVEGISHKGKICLGQASFEVAPK